MLKRIVGHSVANSTNPALNPAAGIDLVAAEARYAALPARGQLPSLRQVKRELYLGQDRARLVLAHLAQVQGRTLAAS